MDTQSKVRPGLTGNQLKIIALIAMTCDHVGLQLMPRIGFLRIIGRLALPVFAWMIAEGCRYTRNRRNYLLRLTGLAAVCQVVYFFAMGSLYMCILVTFSLSVCSIFAVERARKDGSRKSILLAAAAATGVLFVCLLLPKLLPGTDFAIDYGIWGVLLPVLAYFGGKWQFSFGLGMLALQYGGMQWFGLAAVPLLMLYNGQKGRGNLGKLFYLYYPLHLVVIYGISLLF